jgi:hypothetical protein
MKKLFIVALLISNVYLFAQSSQITLQPRHYTPTTLKNIKLNTPAFAFSQMKFYVKNDFSVYNRTTMFNDNFSVYNGKMEYKNSIIIPQNLISNAKMDSFNPNASDSFEGALLMGTINLLADLFNTK